MPEYNNKLMNDIISNFANIVSENNESSSLIYDSFYDSRDNNLTNIMSNTGGSQHLATILEELFSKMSDNQTISNSPSSSSLSSPSTGFLSSLSLSRSSLLPASSKDGNSFYLLSMISLWFVLIVNPIVVLFGVIGNLLAIYIFMNGNIAKLPVSFYTIMLNISDTFNLLIPVFIFWLDNCFNRTPERGYFRDRSNFLCKALMCPEQLFAALSAWYMCAISFNRWCSVCRPSTYFFRTSSGPSTTVNKTNLKKEGRTSKQSTSSSLISSSLAFCCSFTCCFCLIRNVKYRQHLQAFHSIVIITLLGILCCLYPIFMHELRPVLSTNQYTFDLTQKITRTYPVDWKRCNFSRKHQYVYDIIGIILTSLLHILPLTFVAAMNIMIILRLRQRQRLMTSSTNTIRSAVSNQRKRTSVNDLQKRVKSRLNSLTHTDIKLANINESLSQSYPTTTHKDQETLTDSPLHTNKSETIQVRTGSKTVPRKRHHSRNKNITIMLVSVALSYFILTLPYRLFWSYNVYIKRMHPEKLNSSVYLLKMHYIDHVLRTIRNLHYGTNFIFFIFLSKPFRRKFQQLFSENFCQTSLRFFARSSKRYTNNNIGRYHQQDYSVNLEETNENSGNRTIVQEQNGFKHENSTKNGYNETSSLTGDMRIQEEILHSIVILERIDPLREI